MRHRFRDSFSGNWVNQTQFPRSGPGDAASWESTLGVLVGTSGWQYRDWRDTFYPPDVPQRRWLEYYAC